MAERNSSEAQASPSQPSNIVNNDNNSPSRTRSSTQSSGGRLRSASVKFLESSPPSGMWHATGTALAQAPTPLEIRRGEFDHSGWNGELQRRNSNISEESMQRVSRQSSAQTPGSMARTMTNPLHPHQEAEDEGHVLPPTGSGRISKPVGTKGKGAAAVDDEEDDDPFSKFIGRGRIDSQSFEPKSKTASGKATAELVDPLDDEDDTDSLDDLDPRPKKRQSALPKKFLDPTGQDVPMPEDKLTTIKTSRTEDPPSPILGAGPNADGVYPNGYKFPAKHTWGESTVIGLKAFWRFTITPFGFLVVIYGLNVVAWGGMLFLLLIGGGKQFMCYPPNKPPGYKDCNDLYSPRRVWIEIDSQILNALFCVTGFGLVPWRFRDLFYLLQFRLRHKQSALRRLAGIHRAWFRLPGSQDLPPAPDAPIPDAERNAAVPLPIKKIPDPPLTGFRAPASKLWKLDYVIWAYVFNTFLQIVLSVFMWSMNRFDRPSWSTGLFVALACIVAGLGGLMAFMEGKKIKSVEGIPVKEEEVLNDVEKQVTKSGKGKGEKM